MFEADKKWRNDVMSKMSEITVLRGLSDAIVVDRPSAPNASPIAETSVLTARVVAY